MAEYVANAAQTVALNSPVLLNASIPCNKGYVYHDDDSGIFTLRGSVNNPSCGFARYQVTFNGNIAIPTGGTVGPIALAIAVSGEPRLTSKAIFTPAAVEEFGNVTCTAIITVPKCCCFPVSVDYVDGTTEDPATTPTPVITVQNANLVITRIS